MEVSVISSGTIKPSSLESDLHPKPYKLSLFDQITPFTYASIIVFYRAGEADSDLNVSETLARLKTSLSETLALFYPFSGRLKDNLYVDDSEAGVAYLETNVNCSLAEYFRFGQTELLNKLVPFRPFCNETDTSKPLMGFQINIFTCGGMAIGTSLGHKIADGGTLSHLLMSWAAMFRGTPHKIMKPNLTDASLAFPPRDDLPDHFHTQKMWFNETASFVTRRFVFAPDAVDALRHVASSKRVPKPSCNEAITSFIWKHANAASQAAKGGPKPRASIIAQAANMRPRMKSQEINAAIGNLFWWARADSHDAASAELPELVGIVKQSLVNFNSKYLESMKGDVAFSAASEFFDMIDGIVSEENGPEIYGFSNWSSFFNGVNFGWGKPVWVSPHGKVGPAFRNMVFLIDTQDGKKGIDAFLTLEEKHMAVLQKDPKFLAFATPNPEGVLNMLL